MAIRSPQPGPPASTKTEEPALAALLKNMPEWRPFCRSLPTLIISLDNGVKNSTCMSCEKSSNYTQQDKRFLDLKLHDECKVAKMWTKWTCFHKGCRKKLLSNSTFSKFVEKAVIHNQLIDEEPHTPNKMTRTKIFIALYHLLEQTVVHPNR